MTIEQDNVLAYDQPESDNDSDRDETDVDDNNKSTAADETAESTQGSGDADDSSRDDEANSGKSASETSGSEEQGVSDALLSRANQYGMSVDEARKFGSDEALSRTLAFYDQRIAQAGQQSSQTGQQQSQTSEGQTDQAAEQSDPNAYKPYELSLDPELFDADAATAITGINEHFNGAMGQMHEQLQSVLGHFHHQQQQAAEKEFDSGLAGLGEGYHGLFGKGASQSLDRYSTEYTNRVRLNDEMGTYQAGRQQMGLPPLPESELLQNALQSAFGQQLQQQAKTQARKQVSEKLRNNKGQFTAPPTNVDGKTTGTPKQRAVASVASKLQEFGIG